MTGNPLRRAICTAAQTFSMSASGIFWTSSMVMNTPLRLRFSLEAMSTSVSARPSNLLLSEIPT